MSRRRLWSLTALACLVLVLPGIPVAQRARALDAAHAVLALGELGLERLPPPDPRFAQLAIAATSVLIGLGLVLRRRMAPAAERATRLARRGRSVAVIARRTGLAQDAVRDLLGGDPEVVSTAVEGRFFRRARAASPSTPGAFAAELSERSFEPKA